MNYKDFTWAYSAQLLNSGAALILLPCTLRYFSGEEMGLWYLFISLAGISQLMELGLQPTIARQVSYVYAGASTIQAQGLPSISKNKSLNVDLLGDLFFSAYFCYLILSVAVAIVLVVGGSFYLTSLPHNSIGRFSILLPWIFYAAGAVISFGGGVYSGFLQGRNQITVANKILAHSKILMVTGTVVALISGFGLLGAAVCYMLSMIYYRICIKKAYLSLTHPESRIDQKKSMTQIRPLWLSAWRLGIVQIGSFLLLRGNLFVASLFCDLSAIASYGLTLQILSLLSSMATIFNGLKMPHMIALQMAGHINELKNIFAASIISAATFYVAGALFVIGPGIIVLNYITNKTQLLDFPLLILAILVYFLEMVHSISAAFLTTFNRIPFLWASLASGFGVVLLSFLLMQFSDFGIAAAVISQGIVQLIYNNWKWPREAILSLETNAFELVSLGVVELTNKLNRGWSKI